MMILTMPASTTRRCATGLLLCALGAWLMSCTTTQTAPSAPPADMVITDARIWTGNSEQPFAEALAVRAGVIVAVGDSASVASLVGPKTTSLSLPGRFVMPGLIDGHVHPLGGGRQHAGCDLQGKKTVQAIQDAVKACHERTLADGGIVSGRGWNLSLFPEANPHRRVLDEVTGDRPAWFRGEDGHSGWANSAMLKMAGITKDTPNPAHGVIEHDADGTPSGTLREDALEIVEKLLAEPTLKSDVEALRWALHEVSSFGITSVMDAGVDERRLEAYAVLARENALPVDVIACIVVDPTTPDKALAMARDLRTRYAGLPRLEVTSTKIYLDGVLEGETAALLAPYLTHPDHKGAINAEPAQLNALVTALEGDGFQVHMHVIGDAAARAALDAYEASHAKNGDKDLRGTLAHLQLVDAADHPRFKQLGVIANAQSYWAYPDTYILDINLPQVGQARVDAMYPWGSLARAGARVVGGSDWPVSSLNPLDAVEVMVTRQDPAENGGPVLNANEALSLDGALRAYTTEGAFLLHHEDTMGQLKTGMAADIVVFGSDLVAGPSTALNDAKVQLTIKAGHIVYDAAAEHSAGPVATLLP